MLRAIALALLLLAVPAASADPVFQAGEPPCDGQPVVPEVEPQDQVRTLEVLCTYGPQVTGTLCASVMFIPRALFIVVEALAPGQAPPEPC